MKPISKYKIANSLGANQQLNKKLLDIKTSWDKVDSMVKNATLPKKKTGK